MGGEQPKEDRSSVGPARVGALAYPVEFVPLEHLDPTHCLLCAASEELLQRRYLQRWSIDSERRLALAKLKQRHLLLELGEADTRIPWHERDLDLQARSGALSALASCARLTSVDVTFVHQALQTLLYVHADPRLDNEYSAADLALVHSIASQLGYNHISINLVDRAAVDIPASWSEVADAVSHALASAPSKAQLRSMPSFALDFEQAVNAELQWEQVRSDRAEFDVELPSRPQELIGGTVIWTGSRVRIGLFDELETFLPDWVAISGRGAEVFPSNRNEALAAAAWRLSHRGPVTLVATTPQAFGQLAAGLTWLRRQAQAGQHTKWPLALSGRHGANLSDPLPRFSIHLMDMNQEPVEPPPSAAVLLSSAQNDGVIIDEHWLTTLCSNMHKTPTPLLLCAVDGDKARQRVIRDVLVAERVVKGHPRWRSPVARVLQIFAADFSESEVVVHSALIRRLCERHPHAPLNEVVDLLRREIPRLDEWVSGTLIEICRRRCGELSHSLAWKSTDGPILRDALQQLRGRGAADGDSQ